MRRDEGCTERRVYGINVECIALRDGGEREGGDGGAGEQRERKLTWEPVGERSRWGLPLCLENLFIGGGGGGDFSIIPKVAVLNGGRERRLLICG